MATTPNPPVNPGAGPSGSGTPASPDLNQALADLTTKVGMMANTLSQLMGQLGKTGAVVGSASTSFHDLGASIEYVTTASKIDSDSAKKLKQAWKEYTDASEEANNVLRDLQSGHKRTAAEIDHLNRQLNKHVQIAAGNIEYIEKERRNRDLINAAIKRNTAQYITLGQAIQQTNSKVKSGLTFLGATAFGGGAITKARDALLDYNQNMFKFSRAQQVLGKGVGNLKLAFDTVSSSTTLSRQKFTEFLNVAASGWKGITPSAEAIAGLARDLQSAFGPNVELAKEKLKSFLELQNKFPAMANTIKAAMEKIQNNKVVDPKQIKSLMAQIATMRMSGQISREAAMDYAQMLTKTTKKQDDQVRSNKAMAKMSQRSEDLMLNMAQAAEPALTKIAETLQGVVEQLGKMPGLIMASAAAFALMNKMQLPLLQMQIPTLTTMMKGLGGKGFKGMGPAMSGGMAAGLFGKTPQMGNAPQLDKAYQSYQSLRSSGVGAQEAAKQVGLTGAQIKLARAGAAGTGGGVTGSMGVGARMMGGIKGVGPLAAITGLMQGYFSGTSEYQQRKTEGLDEGTAKGAGLRKGAGAAIGSTIGGIGGAAVGSIFGPVGTVIGGMVGGVAGSYLGEMFGKKWSNAYVKEAKKGAKEVVDEVAQELSKELRIAELYQEKIANLNMIVESTKKVVDLQKEQLNMLEEMGVITAKEAPNLFAGSIEGMKQLQSEYQKFFKDMFEQEGIGEVLKGQGVELDESAIKKSINKGDFVEAAKGAVAAANKELAELGQRRNKLEIDLVPLLDKPKDDPERVKVESEIESIKSKQYGITQNIAEITDKATASLRAQVDLTKLQVQSWSAAEESALKYNNAAEQRLQTEKDLMEAAQFGMGASIAMMQKQADMAYQLMELEKQRIALGDDMVTNLLKQKGATDDQAGAIIGTIKNAKSFMEVQQIIKDIAGDNAQEQFLLNNYYNMQQDATNKIMQQQKKVYELTKGMREGYLDAIREMSVGAGEFEKIIGTQEMGVTQLMDAVNKVSDTPYALNTMKLGGYQAAGQTAAGLGTDITGQYAATGRIARFLPGQGGTDSQEARNQRIYGWQNSIDQYNKMMTGEGGQLGVGTGLGGDQYLNAMREGSTDGTEKGTFNGMKRFFKGGFTVEKAGEGGYDVGGREISKDVMYGAQPGMGFLDSRKYNPNERQDPGARVDWSAGVLGRAQPSEPAPGFFPLPGRSGPTQTIPWQSPQIYGKPSLSDITMGRPDDKAIDQYFSDLQNRNENFVKAIMTSSGIEIGIQNKLLTAAKKDGNNLAAIKGILKEQGLDNEVLARTVSQAGDENKRLDQAKASTKGSLEDGGFSVRDPGGVTYYKTRFPSERTMLRKHGGIANTEESAGVQEPKVAPKETESDKAQKTAGVTDEQKDVKKVDIKKSPEYKAIKKNRLMAAATAKDLVARMEGLKTTEPVEEQLKLDWLKGRSEDESVNIDTFKKDFEDIYKTLSPEGKKGAAGIFAGMAPSINDKYRAIMQSRAEERQNLFKDIKLLKMDTPDNLEEIQKADKEAFEIATKGMSSGEKLTYATGQLALPTTPPELKGNKSAYAKSTAKLIEEAASQSISEMEEPSTAKDEQAFIRDLGKTWNMARSATSSLGIEAGPAMAEALAKKIMEMQGVQKVQDKDQLANLEKDIDKYITGMVEAGAPETEYTEGSYYTPPDIDLPKRKADAEKMRQAIKKKMEETMTKDLPKDQKGVANKDVKKTIEDQLKFAQEQKEQLSKQIAEAQMHGVNDSSESFKKLQKKYQEASERVSDIESTIAYQKQAQEPITQTTRTAEPALAAGPDEATMRGPTQKDLEVEAARTGELQRSFDAANRAYQKKQSEVSKRQQAAKAQYGTTEATDRELSQAKSRLASAAKKKDELEKSGKNRKALMAAKKEEQNARRAVTAAKSKHGRAEKGANVSAKEQEELSTLKRRRDAAKALLDNQKAKTSEVSAKVPFTGPLTEQDQKIQENISSLTNNLPKEMLPEDREKMITEAVNSGAIGPVTKEWQMQKRILEWMNEKGGKAAEEGTEEEKKMARDLFIAPSKGIMSPAWKMLKERYTKEGKFELPEQLKKEMGDVKDFDRMTGTQKNKLLEYTQKQEIDKTITDKDMADATQEQAKKRADIKSKYTAPYMAKRKDAILTRMKADVESARKEENAARDALSGLSQDKQSGPEYQKMIADYDKKVNQTTALSNRYAAAQSKTPEELEAQLTSENMEKVKSARVNRLQSDRDKADAELEVARKALGEAEKGAMDIDPKTLQWVKNEKDPNLLKAQKEYGEKFADAVKAQKKYQGAVESKPEDAIVEEGKDLQTAKKDRLKATSDRYRSEYDDAQKALNARTDKKDTPEYKAEAAKVEKMKERSQMASDEYYKSLEEAPKTTAADVTTERTREERLGKVSADADKAREEEKQAQESLAKLEKQAPATGGADYEQKKKDYDESLTQAREQLSVKTEKRKAAEAAYEQSKKAVEAPATGRTSGTTEAGTVEAAKKTPEQEKEDRYNRIAQNLRDRMTEPPKKLKTDDEKKAWREQQARKMLESQIAVAEFGPHVGEIKKEEWDPQKVDEMQEIAKRAAEKDRSGKAVNPAAMSKLMMEDLGQEGKSYFTSEAQKKHTEASAADQAAFTSSETRDRMQQLYGAGTMDGGGGGGGGTATVVIDLAPDLRGDIKDMRDMLVKIEQQSNAR